MSKEKLTWAAIGLVVGIVLAPQIMKLPLVNRIPQV